MNTSLFIAIIVLIFFIWMGATIINPSEEDRAAFQEARKGNFKKIYSIFRESIIMALLAIPIAIFFSLYESRGDSMMGFGLVVLYGIWKVIKWVAIIGVGLLVLKFILDYLAESVAEKTRK